MKSNDRFMLFVFGLAVVNILIVYIIFEFMGGGGTIAEQKVRTEGLMAVWFMIAAILMPVYFIVFDVFFEVKDLDNHEES